MTEAHVFDLSDPKTYWLNLTNIALGLVTLICCVVVARALFRDISERLGARSKSMEGLDDHAFMDAQLGLTMADGGEKTKEGEKP
jgi:hypothetical protein